MTEPFKRDTELKLLLGCTRQEMRRILAQHNSAMQGGILIERPGSQGPMR